MSNMRPAKTTSSIGAILAAVAAVVLAITNVGTPGIYAAGSNPQTVLMLRAIVTVAAIAVVLAFSGRLRLLSRREEMNSLISGLLFMSAGAGLLTALAISPVSVVVLILYLFPLLTTLFDSIVTRTIPKKMTLLLMALALFGLALALEAGARPLNVTGMLLALLAAISVAATMVWNNHKLHAVDPEQITLRMFIVNLFVFGTYTLFTGSFVLPGDNQGLLLLIFVLACFALAFVVMFRAVQMAGSVRAAMIDEFGAGGEYPIIGDNLVRNDQFGSGVWGQHWYWRR